MNKLAVVTTPQEFEVQVQQAKYFIDSGFLPASINTPAKAILIMQKGREIGVPPIQALNHIHVINGKPTTSAEMQLALIFRNCPGAVVNYIKNSDTECEIKAKRPGKDTEFNTFSFTMKDAERAQLSSKSTWKQYPRAMLRSRCISEMARALFPDCLMGMSYTPEEMGADVTVNDAGEVQAVISGPVISVDEIEKSTGITANMDTENMDTEVGLTEANHNQPMGPEEDTIRKLLASEKKYKQAEAVMKNRKELPEALYGDVYKRWCFHNKQGLHTAIDFVLANQ